MPSFAIAPCLLLLCLSGPMFGGNRPPQSPIDLNGATATELLALPRVGARTARRIVAFRQAHGGFQRPEELLTIKGIGEQAYRRLLPHVTVGPRGARGQASR